MKFITLCKGMVWCGIFVTVLLSFNSSASENEYMTIPSVGKHIVSPTLLLPSDTSVLSEVVWQERQAWSVMYRLRGSGTWTGLYQAFSKTYPYAHWIMPEHSFPTHPWYAGKVWKDRRHRLAGFTVIIYRDLIGGSAHDVHSLPNEAPEVAKSSVEFDVTIEVPKKEWDAKHFVILPMPVIATSKNPPVKGSRLDTFRLEKAQTFSFHARTFDARLDEATKKPILVQGPVLFVTASRPGSLRIEDKTDRSKIKPGEPFIVRHSDLVVTNGKTLLVASIRFKEYVTKPGVSDIEDIREGTALSINGDFLFVRDFTKAFTFKFESTYKEGDVQVYDYVKDYKYREKLVRTRLILDAETGLPVRVSHFEEDSKGALIETERVLYSDWTLNAEYPGSLFDPIPPSDAKHVQEQKPEPLYDPKWKVGMTPEPIKTVDLDGKEVSLERFQSKVILLDYWATWCGPCQSEIPEIKELFKQYHKKGLEIVGISLDEPSAQERLMKAIQQKGLTWHHLYDSKGFQSPFVTAYKISAIPFNILIGRDGKIAAIDLHGKELATAVEKAVSP